jgi:hypothetical protein
MVHQLPDFKPLDKLLATMEKTEKLNGWWRLWVVVSCIWIIFATTYAVAGWFDDGLNKEIAKHDQIYQQFDSTNKAMIFENEGQSSGKNPIIVEIKDEANLIYFKPEIEESKMLEFTRMYCKIGNKIQYGNRIKYISIALTLIIIPPITLSILGVSIAWIIKGFKS